MFKETDKTDLGFLGEEFQYKLIHELMDDKELFMDLSSIINQNMFTDPNLKVYVGLMKEYYNKHDVVPSYDIMRIQLLDKAHNDIEREYYTAIVKKLIETPSDGSDYIKDLATKFFRQQNIIRTANKILEIAGNGNIEKYQECVDLLNAAMTTGIHEELGVSVFDNLEETLSDDYRVAVPTGIDKIDETLEGGLGKGELGVIVGPSSFGKSQPLYSRILTPNGYKRMGEMKVGDYVVGPDGKNYEVSGVFPQGKRPIYEVTFSNGTSCECDIKHLWTVKTEGENEYKTVTLNDIIVGGLSDGKKFYLPPISPLLMSDKEVPIEPYLVGRDAAKTWGGIIPTEYLFNSIEKRFALLNGLMDTCGDVDRNGKVCFVGNDISIAKNVQFLVRSLAGNAEIQEMEDNNYLVTLNLPKSDFPLFSKKDKEKKVKYTDNDAIYMVSAEYLVEQDAQCIMVDSNDHLYITEDFIVTHNTSLTTAMASYAATYRCEQNNNQGYKVLQIVFEDRIKQIQRKHIGRITGVESKDLSKSEYVDLIREQLKTYEETELLQNNLKIVRFPSGEKTPDDIKRFIKKLINHGFKPDMVIIDYFETLKVVGDGTTTNEWEKEGKTMRKLESMAGDMDFALWVPVQGTKDSVNAELVTMDKAGGSFKKIQIAHIVMSIARTNEDIEANKATIAILKNRAGKAGKVFNNVEFNNGTCRISTNNVDELDSMFAYDKKQRNDEVKLQQSIFKMAQIKK